MDSDTTIKLAIYEHIVRTTEMPSLSQVTGAVGASESEVKAAYQALSRKRMLVLEPDGVSIRMAPPFSGVPTQHRVRVSGQEYFANCAWDSFGMVAALGGIGEVLSRCEQTHQPLRLRIEGSAPPESGWVFHTVVPAAQWWRDIVFT